MTSKLLCVGYFNSPGLAGMIRIVLYCSLYFGSSTSGARPFSSSRRNGIPEFTWHSCFCWLVLMLMTFLMIMG